MNISHKFLSSCNNVYVNLKKKCILLFICNNFLNKTFAYILYNNLIFFIDNLDVERTEDEVAKIKKLALQNNISQVALQKLIDILRNFLPQLAVFAKYFIGTKYTYNIETFVVVEGENYILDYVRDYKTAVIQLYIFVKPLQINVDSVLLYKLSQKQLWPILCKVHYDPDIYINHLL